MLRIPNWFFKETEICVFIDAHWQKRIQKHCIQYQVKYGVENSLDALEMVLIFK